MRRNNPFIALSALVALALPCRAPADSFVSFDAPLGNRTEAIGINNSGVAVGTMLNNPDTTVQGFIFDGTQLTPVAYPSGRTDARGINNFNQVVGRYGSNNSGSGHGYVWLNGVFTTVDYPGSPATECNDINNNGQVLGVTRASNGAYSGSFLWSSGTFTPLSLPGEPYALNDSGQIVGSDGDSGFLFDHGTVTAINVPSATYTQPLGINDQGEITGTCVVGGAVKGFLMQGSQVVTFSYPGAWETLAYGINDSGTIVGFFRDSPDGLGEHGFIATVAIPEPASATLLIVFAFIFRATRGRGLA